MNALTSINFGDHVTMATTHFSQSLTARVWTDPEKSVLATVYERLISAVYRAVLQYSTCGIQFVVFRLLGLPVPTIYRDYVPSSCCMLSVMDCMSIVMFQTMDSVYATSTLMILSALLHLSLTKREFSAI